MRVKAHCALWTTGLLLVAPVAVLAQDVPQVVDDSSALVPEAPLTPEENAMLGNALVFDPAALATPPKKPLRLPRVSDKDFDISRTEKPDGSSIVVVKQPLQTELSNSAGADLGPTSGRSAFDHPLLTAGDSSPSGAAWASIGVANFGSVDARVDPFNEQGKVGTTLKQSIPFGGRFAVTLQNTYSVTETLGQPAMGPTDMPFMTLPTAATPGSSQVFGNERSVKFNILPTGTTLGAGLTSVSNDPIIHNTFSAEQKLYGPLQVTTALTDFGQVTSSKSISAGFKVHW